MADQELTGQGAVVGEGQGTGAEGVVSVQPTDDEQAQAIAGVQEGGPQSPAGERRVELTELQEFRAWQAARDRREAQLQQQLQQEQRQREEMQREIAQLRLRDADPEQVAAYYQQEMERLQSEQQQAMARQAEEKEIVRQGQEMLQGLGLQPDTPGLVWSETPSWEGFARLAESAAKLVALQQQAAVQESRTAGEEVAQQAKVEALRQAGVTQVSTAVGQPKRPDLRAEYEKELAKLKGSGDMGAYARLKRVYREKGLDV